MPTNAIIISDQSINLAAPLLAGIANPTKDQKSRIGFYGLWLAQTGGQLYAPDLVAYRDYLMSNERTGIDPRTGEIKHLAPLSPATVAAHLGSIKGRYKMMLSSNSMRDVLYSYTPQDAPTHERKATVDEYITRLRNAIDSKDAAVKIPTNQDKQHGTRLTKAQANALMKAPYSPKHYADKPLRAARDTAIITLMLCTGLREAELCALDVQDLRESDDSGVVCLRVRLGKGKKSRLIPYGDSPALASVEKWLAAAGIDTGAVFRGLNTNNTQLLEERIIKVKGKDRVIEPRLVTRTINKMLDGYKIMINGKLTSVKPHDLRRTYAYQLRVELDFDLDAIQANLGHTNIATTQRYIGNLDLSARAPYGLYS